MSGLRKPAEIFRILAVLASIVMSLAVCPPTQAQQSPAVLFQNVRIFDGKNGALSPPSNVLVRNNRIERISIAAIAADAQVINGGGRVLMPGLIDAHWHAMLVRPTPAAALAGDVGYTNLSCGCGSYQHAHAGLHDRSRHGRAGLWAQAIDR